MSGKESSGISIARRLFKARKGPPTEADGPGRPSNPPRVLDGQIDIFGRIHRRNVQSELDIEAER
jgi:hypothetical protein